MEKPIAPLQTDRPAAPQPVGTRRALFGRAIGLAAGGAGLAGTLAACAQLPGMGGKTTSKETVTLRLIWRSTEAEWTFAQRNPVFEEKNPHIKLQVEFSDDYYAKVGVLFSSNSIGDVMFLEADDEAHYAFWAAQGMLTQLDPYIKRDKYDMNVFFPTAVEALKVVDGKIWSFPYKAFMARVGLFYNASIFKQNGLKVPDDNWTYDEMRTTAQRLTKRNGSEVTFWGGGRNFGGDFSFMAITRAFGGDLYSQDGKKTLIASEQSRQAVTWWLDRYHKEQSMALNPGTTTPRTLVEQGKAAFAAGYNPGDRRLVANALNPTGQEWGCCLQPKGPSGRRGGAFFLTPTGLAKISKHPDEAWEYQKFLAEKETGVVMGFPSAVSGQTSAHFGARKDVYTDPRVLNAPDMPPGVMAALARSMELPEPYYSAANFLANDVEKVLNDEMGKAVRGQVQYDTGFFQNLASQIQVILDKPAPAAAK